MSIRSRVVNGCASALRFYTHHVPFARGRGVFIRTIEHLKRRGWPPPLIPIGHGLVMEFEPSLIGWTLFERGEWEPAQTALFLSLLSPGSVVLNVGANTGYYTLLAGAVVGSAGQVHAFEIQPGIAGVLRRNVERNGFGDRVSVVEKGCFSTAGEATIEEHGDPGSARIRPGGSGRTVPLITLDAYVASARLERTDVLMIDTEGADFEILKGASDLLWRCRPAVIAEVHHLEAFGGSEEQLRGYMAQFGYAGTPIIGEFSRDILFVAGNRESVS